MDFGVCGKQNTRTVHFPTDLKSQSCPLANQIRAVATVKQKGAWPGGRLWRHTKSRLTLHGKLAKAKPWNCTTRFSHFVHDTISFSTAGYSGAHVCKATGFAGLLGFAGLPTWHACVHWGKIHLWKSKIFTAPSILFSIFRGRAN